MNHETAVRGSRRRKTIVNGMPSSGPKLWNVNSFRLESGILLSDAPICYQSWGNLNDQGDNCIVVCHALTGDTDVSDWWENLIGPGRAFDTSRFFVICLNVPGSPYGSLSPVTVDPATGKPFGPAFPKFTIRDVVAIHRKVIEALGVKKVCMVAGGSLGGMQAVEWAAHADIVNCAASVACGPSHSPWCIGWGQAQRQAIRSDPSWKNGLYSDDEQPEDGLRLARQIAMMTYRSAEQYAGRFERDIDADSQQFAVESYLEYQGKKLVSRFDANCYLALTELMDTHDITRARTELSTFAPTIVVSVSTDVLYSPSEQVELAGLLHESEFATIDSPHGHDGFLIEQDKLNELLSPWLQTHNPSLRLSLNQNLSREVAAHAECAD